MKTATNPTPSAVRKGTQVTYVALSDGVLRTTTAKHKPRPCSRTRVNVHCDDGSELIWNARSRRWDEVAQ